jgi:hypothetical protein
VITLPLDLLYLYPSLISSSCGYDRLQSFIALSFGTHEGEGGVFALFIGLFPLEQHTEYEGRALTGYSTKGTSSGQGDFKPRFGEKFLRAKMRVVLMVWVRKRCDRACSTIGSVVKVSSLLCRSPLQAFLGVSLVLADGVLTPAVSVVSYVPVPLHPLKIISWSASDSSHLIVLTPSVSVFTCQRRRWNRRRQTIRPECRCPYFRRFPRTSLLRPTIRNTPHRPMLRTCVLDLALSTRRHGDRQHRRFP